ncbi:MAG: deoxyribodipyrimidine photo-lyase [Myxococcota bacterium]|jgi:deoxyribodipyrimidine photo-lyase
MLAPSVRVHHVNNAPVQADGDYVLYWMIAARRRRYNWALEHAVAVANALGKPLLILEPLRIGYRWASTRMHVFAVQGMADNAVQFADAGVRYLPYLERNEGDGKGLLSALSARACHIITDTWPCFFVPRMVAAAGKSLDVRLTEIDGIGLYPLRATDQEKKRAVDFRRLLQKELRPHLEHLPEPDPLDTYDGGRAVVAQNIIDGWDFLTTSELTGDITVLCDGLDINTAVRPACVSGGWSEAKSVLDDWLITGLPHYADGRNHPDEEVATGLSPWVHWGHIGAHEIIHACLDRDDWTLASLGEKATAKREGWWGASPEVEAFLDQIVTWRELGHHFSFRHPEDYDQLSTLPEWAQKTIAEHAGDERPVLYSLQTLDAAATHDPIWNAAQRQLKETGIMHNYLRMLWGKKVLEWSESAQQAVHRLIHLNNLYAIDGRDPNSYSGIFWVFGRFDRAWGPVRPIFGKLRYMTSDSTKRKLKMNEYLERWGD